MIPKAEDEVVDLREGGEVPSVGLRDGGMEGSDVGGFVGGGGEDGGITSTTSKRTAMRVQRR
jgi:hypothetical protein